MLVITLSALVITRKGTILRFYEKNENERQGISGF